MTTQQEAEYINRLLPKMAEYPGGFSINDLDEQPATRTRRHELASLARRLADEGIARPVNPDTTFRLALTPLGKKVAEGENGYLGYLARQEQQDRLEDRRAERSANGSWISGIAAAVGIALSIYSIHSGSQDSGALKIQIETQARRIRALEIQLQHNQQH
jgi:uncharacterized protein involved in type VI secretion and phage assembly